MNKGLKLALIFINLVMLGIAVSWYMNQKEHEPLIIIFGQAATLLGILFEANISEVITKGVSDSKLKVDTKPGSKIHTSNIKKSEIDIKNR